MVFEFRFKIASTCVLASLRSTIHSEKQIYYFSVTRSPTEDCIQHLRTIFLLVR